jgi:SPP1 family predicted phage head-tail adaptor
MSAGNRPHRIVLQSPGGVTDSVGERTTVWTDAATVYAEIRGLTAREMMAAGQRQAITSHVITFPFGANVAAVIAAWRVKYGTRIFTVEGVLNVDEAKKTIQLFCTESVREE